MSLAMSGGPKAEGSGIIEGRAIAQLSILISQVTILLFRLLQINCFDWDVLGSNRRWNLGETGCRRIKERMISSRVPQPGLVAGSALKS
jgi:hypothetical protein